MNFGSNMNHVRSVRCSPVHPHPRPQYLELTIQSFIHSANLCWFSRDARPCASHRIPRKLVWPLPHGTLSWVRQAHGNILSQYSVICAVMEGSTKVFTCHSNLWEDIEGAEAGSYMITHVIE